MSINDQTMLSQTGKGSDIYPGVANPTSSASGTTNPIMANFVDNPTTPSVGAGAGSDFNGHEDAKRSLQNPAGVVEARPGIIEYSNVAPLDKDDKGGAASRFPGVEEKSEPGLVARVVDTVLGK
ncbi:hypothetical protein D9613_003012 [Agrocybe pediades]|uniref:Uncharacterized protein n=1 Tax=Agrocybe pediades TaxID=84607 RepID=A0A8H4QQY6_9AGAR|nr:hypothetical protein D9613_003012 [Agrocybe pediades]